MSAAGKKPKRPSAACKTPTPSAACVTPPAVGEERTLASEEVAPVVGQPTKAAGVPVAGDPGGRKPSRSDPAVVKPAGSTPRADKEEQPAGVFPEGGHSTESDATGRLPVRQHPGRSQPSGVQQLGEVERKTRQQPGSFEQLIAVRSGLGADRR